MSTIDIRHHFGAILIIPYKRYGSNFVLAIAGIKDDLDEPVIREAFNFLEGNSICIVPVLIQ